MRVSRRRIDKFYKSRKWAGIRAVALFRYGEQCRNDNKHLGPFHVDHIIPISEWWEGRRLLTNLQVLCVLCHILKHHPNLT